MSQLANRRMRKQAQNVKRPRKPRVDIEGLRRFFAQQPDVVVAYLFGSVAKGTARPQSDVDIAVLFDARIDPFERGEHYLQLLGSDLERFVDRSVDIRMLNETDPIFCAEVVKYGHVVSERSRAERIAFEAFTMANYADTKFMRDFFTQDIYRRIREGRFGGRGRRHHSLTLEAARRLYGQIARTTAR